MGQLRTDGDPDELLPVSSLAQRPCPYAGFREVSPCPGKCEVPAATRGEYVSVTAGGRRRSRPLGCPCGAGIRWGRPFPGTRGLLTVDHQGLSSGDRWGGKAVQTLWIVSRGRISGSERRCRALFVGGGSGGIRPQDRSRSSWPNRRRQGQGGLAHADGQSNPRRPASMRPLDGRGSPPWAPEDGSGPLRGSRRGRAT